jgi:hypothetical protein
MDNPRDRDPHETGRQGGLARAERLPAEARSEIARRAAQKRWGTIVLRAEHTGDLVIGDMTLACAVIDDGTKPPIRVINQGTMLEALGRSRRPKGGDAGTILFADNLQPFIPPELDEALRQPFTYITPGGRRALGYPAEILPQVCEVYLEARHQHKIRKSQEPASWAAEVLLRGLARVGITALVDEATGYQDARAKDALAKILEAYVAKELQPWVRTFPPDYYREMFRLRGLDYPRDTPKRPQYFGRLTNDIVYRRIAPGVLSELKRVQIKDDEGRPKHKLFQRLTTNAGYPKLREHLGSVVTLMKLSRDWGEFRNMLDRIHPRYGDTMLLPFDDDIADTGSGL